MSTEEFREPRTRLSQPKDLDLNEFFNLGDDQPVVRNDDLESAVPNEDKNHLLEVERYWINPPFCYAVIFKSMKDQEHQYYLIEPQLNVREKKLVSFLKDKIRQSLDYDSVRPKADRRERSEIIREKTYELMESYNLLSDELVGSTVDEKDGISKTLNTVADKIYSFTGREKTTISGDELDEQVVEKLDRRQAEKVIYYIIRDYIGYERIDGVMRDIYVEDLSQSGWGENLFIVHSEYDQLITNISFGKENLDKFVSNLSQKAEKGISKRQPDVDATLEDGSRAFLALGDEITDKGSVFDIRQRNKIPFTPIDLINWGTYSIDMMVYLWFAVESGKSAIIAGGTASGKTTTLNAISLFIPSDNKIVSIEDTREIEIPQKNWKPLTTRDSFGESVKGDIGEYRLLRNSLRMRPNYVIFGEARGEEARDLFQNMNTGHTTYSTFHGENSEQVRVRLTNDPINVDETTFSGLDLIITQEEVTIEGDQKRRCSAITELGDYNPGTEKFSIEEPFVWNPAMDGFEGDLITEHMENIPDLIDKIRHERGWSYGELEDEINRRRVVLSYLIVNDMRKYTEVAAVLQGYMNSKNNVMARIGSGSLKKDVDLLKQMRNVNIKVDAEKEKRVPRPATTRKTKQKAKSVLNANDDLYEDIDIGIDAENYVAGHERRLIGDTYKSQKRGVSESELNNTDEDDTPFGYNEAVEPIKNGEIDTDDDSVVDSSDEGLDFHLAGESEDETVEGNGEDRDGDEETENHDEAAVESTGYSYRGDVDE